MIGSKHLLDYTQLASNHQTVASMNFKIENARKKLEKISNKERNSIIFDEKYNEEILNKINEEIKEAFEFAKNSSFPDKSSLSDYIYA